MRGEVEVEMVGVGLGQEIAAWVKVSKSKNSSSMRRCTVFDVTLVGMRGRGDADMLAVA